MKNIKLTKSELEEITNGWEIEKGIESHTYKYNDNGHNSVLQIFDIDDEAVLENKLKKAQLLHNKKLNAVEERIIIPKKTVTVDGKFRGLITPYIDSSFNFDDIKTRCTTGKRLEVLRQAKELVLFLENNGIIHGDLLSQNFLFKDGKVYLIDMHNASVDGLPIDKLNCFGHEYKRRKGKIDSGLDYFVFDILTFAVLKKKADIYAYANIKGGTFSKEFQELYDDIINIQNKDRNHMLIDHVTSKAKIHKM